MGSYGDIPANRRTQTLYIKYKPEIEGTGCFGGIVYFTTYTWIPEAGLPAVMNKK